MSEEVVPEDSSDEITRALNRACEEFEEENGLFVSEAARRVLERSEW